MNTVTLEAPRAEDMTVDFEPEARVRAKKLLQRKHPDNPNMGFRLGVRGGGCSGLSYFMDMDDKVSQYDQVFDVDGIKVIVDRKSMLYLKGTVVRWSGNLMSGGFIFDNPNAAKACGCGTSFTI